MSTLYRIKPLVWTFSEHDGYQSWSADSRVFKTLSVERNNWNDGEWSSWKFKWCVDEFYDEGAEEVESAEVGKKRAEEWFLSRVSLCLDAVEGT